MSESSEISGVEFYWRPGCPFCSSLERKLTAADIPMNKHNIWESDTDRAFVRSVADGNETVPTVSIADVSMVNPSAAQVIELLRDKAPGLVPEGAGEGGGMLGRLGDRLRGS